MNFGRTPYLDATPIQQQYAAQAALSSLASYIVNRKTIPLYLYGKYLIVVLQRQCGIKLNISLEGNEILFDGKISGNAVANREELGEHRHLSDSF